MPVDFNKPLELWTAPDVTDIVYVGWQPGPHPFVVSFQMPGADHRSVIEVDSEGRNRHGVTMVLNRPVPRIAWLNVYERAPGTYSPTTHKTRAEADRAQGFGRSHVLEIDLDAGTCIKHEVER